MSSVPFPIKMLNIPIFILVFQAFAADDEYTFGNATLTEAGPPPAKTGAESEDRTACVIINFQIFTIIILIVQ